MNEIDRGKLERSLDNIRGRVKDPQAGLFGPGSMVWRVNREQVLGLGGGRALLLQTAHPFVAHAVEQHSKFRTDPHGRGVRTFKALFAWIFGDLDSALVAARRVHAVHSKITGAMPHGVGAFPSGTPYAANMDEALLWVHATLWDTPILLYERFVEKLTRQEKEQYYEETKLFALLFGIPESITPPTWGDFLEYCAKMHDSDVLTCDEVAREIARYVLTPQAPSQAGLMKWMTVMTAGLLPERIRYQYHFTWGRYEELVFESSMKALSATWRRFPKEVREAPIYRRAQRRLGLLGEPNWLERQVAKAMALPPENARPPRAGVAARA